MFAVIFEVEPKPERWDQYLDLAKFLKPELEKIDGFLDNERFGSMRRKGRILSLSTWRDEKAIIRWRTLGVHHGVQERGRSEVFLDYHLRVAEIAFDSDVADGFLLQEQRFDGTEVGSAKFVTISELTPGHADARADADLAAMLGLPDDVGRSVVEQEVFESIYNPGKTLLLASWRDASVAKGFAPQPTSAGALRHRGARVIRDYGMFDRREAPQYFPAVNPDRAAGVAERRNAGAQRTS
jgi:heme-degrading monooxygenase HmoA